MVALRLSLCLVLLGGSLAAAADVPSFNRDIRPILSERCYTCHGPDSGARKADLRLDTPEGATDWAIVPGDADSSELISRVASDDPDVRMPPRESKKPPLTPAQVELLRNWINAGAKYEPHWAYIPPQRPKVSDVGWLGSSRPSLRDGALEPPIAQETGGSAGPRPQPPIAPRNDIDRLLLAKMQARGATPSPAADRITLARRLYFDLTGLPPTPAELDEFVADTRPDAYEQLVDKLLASPAFGERMATWWFDLVRFADTVGYHGDQDHRITPYRDYVIKSFNDNLPFNQFTIEQLAGDLLSNPTMWQRIATGYNRVLQTTHEGGAQDAEYRAKMLADRVRNYSEVWLAASMGCCECHDHKFDPFTTEDHYSLQAFFADVDKYGSFEGAADNSLVTQRPPEMFAWTLPVYEQMQKLDAQIAKLDESLAGPLKGDWEKRRARLIRLKRQRVDLEGQFVPTLVTEAVPPREIRILPRGNFLDMSGQVVEPHTPHFMKQIEIDDQRVARPEPQAKGVAEAALTTPIAGGSERATRRPNRLDLAKWTVSRDNPLAARVVVNRLWKMYYGVGLSKVLIDMGSRSEPPPHQELLDWLAVEFMDSGWDIKHMVRLLVTANAYRQSSLPRPELEAIDPDNRLAARQSRFRFEAEQIRDNALAVSGLLVRKVGGDIVRPYQPDGYYASLNFPERGYTASTGEDQFRRAVYVHWQRQFLHPWLMAFDAPSREECAADRPISNTPTAALVLLNDPSFVEAARALAAKAIAEAPQDDVERIRWIWRRVLGREPDATEAKLLAQLLEKHRAQLATGTAADAITSIGISPRSPEVAPAELAAWTSVSRVLLNLNETITRN